MLALCMKPVAFRLPRNYHADMKTALRLVGSVFLTTRIATDSPGARGKHMVK